MEPDTTATHGVYLACAIAGTIFFLLKLGLSAIGGGGDSDGAHVDSGGGDPGAHQVETGNTESSFQILSSYSLSAFAMTFGWAGLTFSEQLKLGGMTSLVLSLMIGITMMFLTAMSFYGLKRLTAPGANFTLADLPGTTARVYQKIPVGGTGIIQVSVQGMLREVHAISADGGEITSHTEVKVDRVVDGALVAVRPLSVTRS